nr:hypothetical protein [Tanacetum cinerariifolium]
MHANKSFNRNPANHRLYHTLIESLIEDENAMDKGVADTVKDHKRKHDDDEDLSTRPNQGKKTKKRRTKESESSKKSSFTKETSKGKAPTKGSKTGKSASTKEPIEEPIAKTNLIGIIQKEIVSHRGYRTVAVDYFFNNDLEYLKTFDPKAILGVKSVNVKKLHGYGHLEEIVFSNGTLKSVHDKLHHRVFDFRLDYKTEMPTRKWTAVDRKRSGLTIELIDKKLRERKIIRNLERLVGAQELEIDYKLVTLTI